MAIGPVFEKKLKRLYSMVSAARKEGVSKEIEEIFELYTEICVQYQNMLNVISKNLQQSIQAHKVKDARLDKLGESLANTVKKSLILVEK